jgi:hypothetical protein
MIRDLLDDGERRSIGRADEAAALVVRDPELVEELLGCLWDRDRLVAARAANALEKATRGHSEWLSPWRRELIGLMEETRLKEIRWQLALMVPRLKLDAPERARVFAVLVRYLEDSSSLVKTFAMQGLFDLAEGDASLRSEVLEKLQVLELAGTPAMRARGRNLLKAAEGGWTRRSQSARRKAPTTSGCRS